MPDTFIDVDHFQLCKYKQYAPGDVFLSQKNPGDGRVITALSDGLGSGIKAGVLAALTATMTAKFITFNIPIKRASEIIMNTLPVCSERGISYATFTLVDISPDSTVKIMEYDNPPYTLIRQETIVEPVKEAAAFQRQDKSTGPKKDTAVFYSSFSARHGDRLIFFSDGVSQAGMGSRVHPFGWTTAKARNFALEQIRKKPEISARELARLIVQQASMIDLSKPKDDISCGVIYFRKPRDMLVLSGPPVHPESDREIAGIFSSFSGRKVISGGTTAAIISRELGTQVKVNMKSYDKNIPPWSEMEGADMVTEGIITLGSVSEILARPNVIETFAGSKNAATGIVNLFLDSDRITFIVGTRINEAHQDPTMPVELDIRRNVVKRIASLLKEKYLKEVQIHYY
ncbi:stage II sporulation protein [Spirochaetia bacterium]|nr:stage II sporulation protein [Spirochaetia bacterium]